MPTDQPAQVLALAETFGHVARLLAANASLDATLQQIVDLAVDTLDTCEHAGISLVAKGKFTSPASSGELPQTVDRIQAEVGEGPPEYRAPEQERPIRHPPGPATDVYQIAAIVYHLATGQTVGRRPVPPSFLRPELTAALDAPVLAGLAPEPAARPALERLLGSLSGVLRNGGTIAC